MPREGETKGVALLVIVGLLFHSAYLFSIFDIYFRSPLVHGMDPQSSDIRAPARRLFLFVADGLRADKFFEVDEHGNSKAPFLRHQVAEEQGVWGVSHARVPTESRPGHVALIAGFYEDVSAVTKGWKTNPVEFDSVFNESVHTWAWGSPDILPMFGHHVPHMYMDMYTEEFEDFASDASLLDTWVFNKVEEMFASAKTNETLKRLLHKEGTVFFLHLLGLDTNGHAHRPNSKEYLDNIKLVDEGIHRVHELIEHFYNDSMTAYIFTADHGMSNRGSHGDGDPANTLTPFLAWGAGIRKSRSVSGISTTPPSASMNYPTPPEWRLSELERVDLYQADVAPLMSTLLGIPFPMNSVGRLPIAVLSGNERFLASNIYANARQVLAQFQRKSLLKQSTSLFFKPYSPLLQANDTVQQIERLIATEEYGQAINMCHDLISACLDGLYYFQVYDWPFLMCVISLGYLGWIVLLITYIVEHYTSFASNSSASPTLVYLMGFGVFVFFGVWLVLEDYPLHYHLYVLFPVIFWVEVLKRSSILYTAGRHLSVTHQSSGIKLFIYVAIFVAALELLVTGFFYRELFSLALVIIAVLPWAFSSTYASTYNSENNALSGEVISRVALPSLKNMRLLWLLSCLLLAIFPILPLDWGSDERLWCLGGLAMIAMGFTSFFLSSQSSALLVVQLCLVMLSMWVVHDTDQHLANKEGLPPINQILSWILFASSFVIPFIPNGQPLPYLTSLFLSLGSAYILLSIAYEVLFYCTLGLTLLVWLLMEKRLAEASHKEGSFKPGVSPRGSILFLFFCYVAFFGTGNIASISSFEVTSTYRFLTVFRPFVMGALLIWKVVLPFIPVACVFQLINRSTGLSEGGSLLLVVAFSDVLSLNFFFLVKDYGSWQDIGISISHFAISNTFIITALALFAGSHLLLRHIQRIASPRHPHQE
ncbi:GPI ethanolamine phosphate transferase 1 [Balamuthia mandrillaris]